MFMLGPSQIRAGRRARRAAPFRCRLVIMAKAPVAGAVKTRLAREMGVATATRFARQCRRGAACAGRADPRWQTCLSSAPDRTRRAGIGRASLGDMPQGAGDLGQRMQRLIAATAPGPVVIIGTDIPGIRRAPTSPRRSACSAAACRVRPCDRRRLLARRLAAEAAHICRPFTGVRWSSEHALADTLANLDGGRLAGFVATLSDVDDAAALARHGDFGGG